MRSFIAVDLDAPIRKALSRAQSPLRELAPKLNYVDPASMHLTLKFLGEIDPRTIPEISNRLAAVCRETRSFAFRIRHLGCFADRAGKLRVVWAGVEDTDGQLADLQTRIESGMKAIGYPPESRPYSPHLTLARMRRPMRLPEIVQHIEAHGTAQFGEQAVDEIVLYESTLTRDGPIYNALARHAFDANSV
jgi:RNA 2',3'-cyclic 3'-phosphodiesterase